MPGEPPLLSVRARVDGEPGRPPRLDVAFETDASVTAVMGPSGAGKSTLLHCLAGLVRPNAGRVALGTEPLFDSESGLSVPPHQRRIALVFQSLALFPHLTVWENVAYGLRGTERAARRTA
ncbi:MAG: ATP-binding cassette domain-containing protein, partial [Deltaproteobacteria bacterium]|nr:ATP-binding cassette domain-containing protein [Deltaproteobacteria bacterium]